LDDGHGGAGPTRDLVSLYDIEAYRVDRRMLDAADPLLDRAEARVLLARGRSLHGRFLLGLGAEAGELGLFERAERLFREAGDERGQGEATFWIGVYHQVVRRDLAAAWPHLRRAWELADRTGDKLVLSCVERHLGFVEVMAGRPEDARGHLAASVRLRREIDFTAGAAAGLVALAECDFTLGDEEAAREHLDEAGALAADCGSDAVATLVDQVRRQLREQAG